MWPVVLNDKKETTLEGAQLAVLMDIRDELQQFNRLLNCPNFIGIPPKLDAINRNTRKRKRRQRRQE